MNDTSKDDWDEVYKSLTPTLADPSPVRMVALQAAVALMPRDGMGVTAEVMLAEAEKIESWLRR